MRKWPKRLQDVKWSHIYCEGGTSLTEERERSKEVSRMIFRRLAWVGGWIEVQFSNVGDWKYGKLQRYKSRAYFRYVTFRNSEPSSWRFYIIGHASRELRGNSYSCWGLHSPGSWAVDKWFCSHKPNLRFGLWPWGHLVKNILCFSNEFKENLDFLIFFPWIK